MLSTQLGRFRLAAFAEGSSLILLVLAGVPLKYFFGIPGFNQVLGPAHGLLFILYVIQSIQIKIAHSWSLKSLLKLFLAAFVPFGTFYMVPKLISKYQRDDRSI